MSQVKDRLDICAGRPYGNDNKKQWIRCGELTLWDDGGYSIRLDTVPTGNWFDGQLKCFKRDDKKQGSQQRQAPRNPNSGSSSAPMARTQDPPSDDFNDDIPF